MKKNTLFYIPIFFIVIIVNILFSTYFISLFLAGVVFTIFLECLKKEYYYMLILSIFTFFVIESTHGFKIFSLSLISLFLYYFIIPKIKHLFSSNTLKEIFYIISFYAIMFLFHIYTNSFDTSSYFIFLINLIIDFIIVGVLL
ncbi:MAG: hypothetical protein U9R39_08955 [Campylobacterota bacterium]|nr:hypothetical protein [Campylobacterota bacterium]